jgi:hypothetical protein
VASPCEQHAVVVPAGTPPVSSTADRLTDRWHKRSEINLGRCANNATAGGLLGRCLSDAARLPLSGGCFNAWHAPTTDNHATCPIMPTANLLAVKTAQQRRGVREPRVCVAAICLAGEVWERQPVPSWLCDRCSGNACMLRDPHIMLPLMQPQLAFQLSGSQ